MVQIALAGECFYLLCTRRVGSGLAGEGLVSGVGAANWGLRRSCVRRLVRSQRLIFLAPEVAASVVKAAGEPEVLECVLASVGDWRDVIEV